MSDIEAVVSTQLKSQVTDSEKRVEATSLIDKEINFKLKTISEKGSAEYFINKDPQLQGKFIDSQSAAAQQKDARVQAQKTKLQSQQGPTQNKQQPIKPQGPMGASTTAFGATQYNPSKQ